MKKAIWTIFFTILGIGIYYCVFSNPIVVPYVNEFGFTNDGWCLEIQLESTENTTGWVLNSNQGTAHLKPMTITQNIPHIITQDSLLEAISIDSSSDILSLCRSSGEPVGWLKYGDVKTAPISAPKIGQSISYAETSLYLDNTPTFGYANDTLNTTGHISGYVRTNTSQPLQGVKVTFIGDTLITDSDGRYEFSSISIIQYLLFSKYNYKTEDTIIQVWPESTITVNVSLTPTVSVDRIESQIAPKEFNIGEPFPNPFNPEMQIQYSLPRKSNVQIAVFDINGKLVDRIYSGHQPEGSYKARWNAAHFTSGVYFIRIQAGDVALSKKCALVK